MFQMKRFLAAFSFAFIALTAVANADNAIMGSWVTTQPVFQNGGMSIDLGMKLEGSSATMSTICTYPGANVLEAKVSVPARIENGTISLQGSGRNKVEVNGMNCEIEIAPAQATYSLQGAELVITSEGQTLKFKRR